MRVWFLKETKSICTSCATGCNTIVGTREDVIYRQTPRENDHVNSCWMCDYGRLNFKYLEAENRLLEPQIFLEGQLACTDWPTAISQAALQLKQFPGSGNRHHCFRAHDQRGALAHGATGKVVRHRNGSTLSHGANQVITSCSAKIATPIQTAHDLILGSKSEPGANLLAISEAVKSGKIKALLILKENTMHLGVPVEQLAKLPALIMMNILSNEATEKATIVLPACGFAEKRGSMVNGKGRLQRLNRAVRPPGNVRDDWEILRDLLQAVGGGDSFPPSMTFFAESARQCRNLPD